MNDANLTGAYFFKRHEMTAGFQFEGDGTFQFFYTYGAVDRKATGSFWIEGNTLKLKSDKQPGKDFTVTHQAQRGTGYTVQVINKNPALACNVLCVCIHGEGRMQEYTDNSGKAHLAVTHCDKLYVQHALFPDVLTLIKDSDNANNYFELTLNSTLSQVSFKGIDFTIEDDRITCLSNYFMLLEDIVFLKA
jgi:hypothetical protein